jgi:hypothetical protein
LGGGIIGEWTLLDGVALGSLRGDFVGHDVDQAAVVVGRLELRISYCCTEIVKLAGLRGRICALNQGGRSGF